MVDSSISSSSNTTGLLGESPLSCRSAEQARAVFMNWLEG
jgi:hypothetical protein